MRLGVENRNGLTVDNEILIGVIEVLQDFVTGSIGKHDGSMGLGFEKTPFLIVNHQNAFFCLIFLPIIEEHLEVMFFIADR